MKRSDHYKSQKMQRTAAFLTCASILIAAIALLALSPRSRAGEADVYSSVLRLHIRANSDSAEDQGLKLAVRDALLPFTAELFSECESMEEAASLAVREQGAILGHVNSTLSALSADYSARARVGLSDFPERNYGGRVYPAGEYTALIVELGQGAGENWWCVLFPSLCLSPAAVTEEETLPVGLTPGQYEVIAPPAESDGLPANAEEPKYCLKFRFLELIFELFGK